MRCCHFLTHALGLALLVGSLAAVAGCAGPTFVVQQYDGPVRPPESIAIIRVNGEDQVGIGSLDGEVIAARVDEDSRLHIEVLPGEHRIVLRDETDPAAPLGRARFVAQAGRTYRPRFEAGRLVVYEVDADSDEMLRAVTPR